MGSTSPEGGAETSRHGARRAVSDRASFDLDDRDHPPHRVHAHHLASVLDVVPREPRLADLPAAVAKDREAQALTAIRGKINQAQQQRTSLELVRQSTLDQAGASLREQFDADAIRGYYQYERHIAHLRDQKDADIRALRNEEADQRAMLEAATRERRVAERLHERRWERYRAYLRQQEQKILDETATMYAARNTDVPDEQGQEPPW